MDEIVKSLGPAFASGFAVQRTLEILDPLLSKVPKLEDYKKIVFSLISLILGMIIAFGAKLQVIHALASSVSMSSVLDMFITGLVISGGTEGLNSVMKFLNYKKEATKVDAVDKTGSPDQRKTLSAAASRL